jgi:preprotein translocase subunit SecY
MLNTPSRILITVAVLLVWRLGSAIPIPGLDLRSAYPHPLTSWLIATPWHATPGPAWSILILGLGPIFSALIFVELLKIASPAFSRWEAADRQGKARLRLYVLMTSLLFAAWQAGSLVSFYERFAAQPGTLFEIAFVISLMAGAALTCWFADMITLYGIGNGFWVLISLPILAAITRNTWLSLDILWHSHDRASRVWWYPSYFPTPAELGLVAIGFTIVAIFLLVFVLYPILRRHESGEYPNTKRDPWADGELMATVWPPTLVNVAAPWLIFPLAIVLKVPIDLAALAIIPAGMVLIPVFTILLEKIAQKQEVNEENSHQREARPILTLALVQTAIWAILLLGKRLQIPAMIMEGWSLIIAVTFLLDLMKRLSFLRAGRKLRAAEPSP